MNTNNTERTRVTCYIIRPLYTTVPRSVFPTDSISQVRYFTLSIVNQGPYTICIGEPMLKVNIFNTLFKLTSIRLVSTRYFPIKFACQQTCLRLIKLRQSSVTVN